MSDHSEWWLEVRWIARMVVEDPVMRAQFLQALAELPPESSARIYQLLRPKLPAMTQSTIEMATVEGNGEAMRLVVEVLQGRTGDDYARALMQEALGGD